MNKEKEIQPVEENQVENSTGHSKSDKKSEPEIWDVADLSVRCSQCNSVTKIATVERGWQFLMPTTSDSTLELFCPTCESKLTMFYENGTMFTEEELKDQQKFIVYADAEKEAANDLISKEIMSGDKSDEKVDAELKDKESLLEVKNDEGDTLFKVEDKPELIAEITDEKIDDLSEHVNELSEKFHEEVEKSEEIKDWLKDADIVREDYICSAEDLDVKAIAKDHDDYLISQGKKSLTEKLKENDESQKESIK